jgi:hypothetical protein
LNELVTQTTFCFSNPAANFSIAASASAFKQYHVCCPLKVIKASIAFHFSASSLLLQFQHFPEDLLEQ